MIDFFAQQDATLRRTGRLLTLFTVALLVYLGLLGALPSLLHAAWSAAFGPGWRWVWDWQVFSLVTGGAGLLFVAGAGIEWLNLADGGPVLAARLGADPLPPASRDFAARQLINIVEEMAIASGRPAPRVFVLRSELAPNALTAGRRADDAVLILTRGTLEHLSRDEIQAVVAHEFSHLVHGDTALDVRLTALLAGLLLIPEMGADLLRAGWHESNPRPGRPESARGPTPLVVLAPFGLLLVAVGYTGFMLARAIQAAAARQRELLADASAVQFTRNPDALAGALTKIAATTLSISGPAGAAKLGHLHFVAAHRSPLLDWFSTHPPIAARLAALAATPPYPGTTTASRFAGKTLAPALSTLWAEIGSITAMPGMATTPLAYSQGLLAALPPTVLDAARHPRGAPAVILGLLLSHTPEQRPTQIALVRSQIDLATADRLSEFAEDIATLHRAKRLPLLGVAMPALLALAAPDKARLLATARALAEHDREISLFEYMLLKALGRRLRPSPAQSTTSATGTPLLKLAGAISIILSACARADAREHTDAARAFAVGTAFFSGMQQVLTLLPPEACGLDAVDPALDRLATAAPAHRRVLLAACARVVSFDRIVSLDEAELVRAIADALDCPLPPLVGIT